MPEFHVPEVISDLSTKQVLTTELIDGLPLDKVDHLPKETINEVLFIIDVMLFSP